MPGTDTLALLPSVTKKKVLQHRQQEDFVRERALNQVSRCCILYVAIEIIMGCISNNLLFRPIFLKRWVSYSGCGQK